MDIRRVTKSEVKRLSLVANPANEMYICSEDFCSVDGNIITAVVLKANQKIFRAGKTDEYEGYYFYFPMSQVEAAAHLFLEQVHNNHLSVNHDPFLEEGLKLQESWVDNGIWIVKLKASDEIMERVRTEELKGLSLESTSVMETVLKVTDLPQFYSDVESLDYETKTELFHEFY